MKISWNWLKLVKINRPFGQEGYTHTKGVAFRNKKLAFKGYTLQITILHPARVTRWLFKTRAKCSIGDFFHADFEIAILSQFCTEINIISQELTQNCSKNCDNIARKSVRQFRQFRQFSRHAPKLTYYRKTKRTIAIKIAIISQGVSAV